MASWCTPSFFAVAASAAEPSVQRMASAVDARLENLAEAILGDDRPDGGCRFEVWLPSSPAPGGETEGMAGATNRTQPKAELPLMLCVEGNPVNALLLQEIIEIIGGCRLLLASDGESALDMAHRHRPHVMVSDLGLPQMDGLALVKAIRADTVLHGMRCVALSGDASAGSLERALQAGFAD